MTSTFGRTCRVTTWGESHGPALGCVIDGCPARLPLSEPDIQPALDRRRPGQSHLTTARLEADEVRIRSGVFEGRTLGTPIALEILNRDSDPSAYVELAQKYRPSHADYTYAAKYGHRDWRGGGRASARETAARVAAGAVAEKLLAARWGVEVVAWVDQCHTIRAQVDRATVSRAQVEQSPVRCPEPEAAREMEGAMVEATQRGDTVGGCIACVVRGGPAGWGEPLFGKLTAILASAMMSIPASRGFEIGEGFGAAALYGSEHNDPFVWRDGRIGTASNHSGGIQGGISNGEAIWFRVAFKPIASIKQAQETVDREGRPVRLVLQGRHDPSVLPRAVPVVEAMCALALVDGALEMEGRQWGPAEPPIL